MQVTPTAATTTGATNTTSGTTSTNNTLDYNNFLQLLVAQLQNQDPTNPSDPTQFVSQLASFSAVEQQVNTNSKLDSMLAQMTLTEAAAFIGRTVTSADGSISGQIASVQVASGGLTANLADGQTLALSSGVKIS
ncbi:MAG: flagellar hook assembly protein FlgD [Rhodomicrobium sp.]|jgi:flagellar basal-body rod modification protein FlgD